MARDFEPQWLPTMIGSVPHIRAEDAWNLVLTYFPDIPAWPQLPRRSYLENMYVQFSERFPGIVLEKERIYVNRERDLDAALERLYVAYLEGDLSYGTISPDYAAGLAMLLEDQVPFMQPPVALKGQITGPITWGLTVTDQNRRPILYNEILAEAITHHLYLKAAWQDQQLRTFVSHGAETLPTIIFVDEPYMSTFGSAFVAISREQVVDMLEEVFEGITGLKGVHCCGNTDWSILLSTSVDILSIDAYAYAESLALYPAEVQAFLERGGIIAWGIVPANEQAATETVESLVGRLDSAIDLLVEKGVSRDLLLQAGLVTPSDGTGTLSEELSDRVFYLTAGVSFAMRERYVDSKWEEQEEA